MLTCRLLGHRYRFAADGTVMRWWCERDCGACGQKEYATAARASAYAAAFDHEDRRDLGKRAPLIGMLPLRFARLFRRTR